MEDEYSNFSDNYDIEAFEAETNFNNNKDDILLEEEIIPGEEYPNQEFEILEHESDAVCAASSDKSKIGKSKIDETEPEFSYWRYFFTPKTPQQTKIQCRTSFFDIGWHIQTKTIEVVRRKCKNSAFFASSFVSRIE